MTSKHKEGADHYFAKDPKSLARFGLVSACLRGQKFEFLTASGVFSVKKVDLGTQVLIENMVLPAEGCLLDLGSGYGAVGIVAAKLNPKLRVVLTDVNRRAVQLARENRQKNRVRNVEVRQGTLYEPVKDLCFNAILSNPPVSAGMETVEAIIRGAPTLLAEDGSLQMVVRSKIGKKILPQAFDAAFGNFDVLAIKSGYRVLSARKKSC